MAEWIWYSLNEVISNIIDYRGKTPKKLGGNWSTQGYRALSARNIKMGKIVQCESIRFVDKALYKKWMKDEIKRRDIIITSEAPFGQIFLWDSDEKIVLSQRLFAIRCKTEFDPYYIFFYMMTDKFQAELRGHVTGTTVIGLRQPELLKCHIFAPDYKEQRRISKVLWNIEQKIDINNRVNDNLEEQAQEIFKSWFINFSHSRKNELERTRYGIKPQKWSFSSLLDIAQYINGLAMQNYRPTGIDNGIPVLKIKELRQGICDSNSELCASDIDQQFIINDGDVIFSWSGSLLIDFWCGGKCGLNQHLFKVISKNYDKWFYYAWTKYHLNEFIGIAKDKATTMGHIKREHLKNALVLIPDKDDYEEIGDMMRPLYDSIISNRITNMRLGDLRDSILPKLMSGEIDVSNIKI